MGYEFVEASRAEKGLKIVEKEKIDLIFLDIQLPNMNGLEAIRKIREIDEKIPVVMVTAFHNIEEVVKNMEVSVQGFIQKPFDLVELRNKILDLLSGEE
jgi:DNA-binding response OmpR family regulator